MGVVVAGGRGECREGHKIVRRSEETKQGECKEARQGSKGARMEIKGAKAVERQGKNKQVLWEPSK